MSTVWSLSAVHFNSFQSLFHAVCFWGKKKEKERKSQVSQLFFLQCSLDKDVIQRKTCSDLGIFGWALEKSLPWSFVILERPGFVSFLGRVCHCFFFPPPPPECWPLLTICLVTPTTFFAGHKCKRFPANSNKEGLQVNVKPHLNTTCSAAECVSECERVSVSSAGFLSLFFLDSLNSCAYFGINSQSGQDVAE